MKKRLISIIMVVIIVLSFPFVLNAHSYSYGYSYYDGGVFFRYDNGNPYNSNEVGKIVNLSKWYLPLTSDTKVSQSALLGYSSDASRFAIDTPYLGFNKVGEWLTLEFLQTHEVAIVRGNNPVTGQLQYYYMFYPEGTTWQDESHAPGYEVGFSISSRLIDMGGVIVESSGLVSYVGNSTNAILGTNPTDGHGMLLNNPHLIYWSGLFSDGSSYDSEIEYIEDGDYIAPAFEFTCFGGKEPDEDGFVRATGLIVDGMDQLSLCFPYLYYKIYPGSQALNNYELRIYEDSMFSENHTLRARITYPEMKDLEVDKTYTYIQSINTYFPIAKNTKYWLTIYDRKAGQAVYTLPVETSAMAKMQANVEHFHIYQVQDGNTVGNPDDYNYEGFFDPFDDIIGGWEPDVPPGDWNEPVPGQLDFANIGEIDEWFTKISGFSSDFIGYVSSVFTFVPAEYWVLIMIGVAIAVLLRIFGR